MSPIKRLSCLVVGCNDEYSSHHLLPTSESLKTQRIKVIYAFKGMRRSPICLNASVRANHSRSSFIYMFYESLQITFPNNVLVIQLRD